MLSDTFLEKGLELFLCSHDFAFRDSLFPVRRQSDSYRDSFGIPSGTVRDAFGIRSTLINAMFCRPKTAVPHVLNVHENLRKSVVGLPSA